jgi:hypothetical protein
MCCSLGPAWNKGLACYEVDFSEGSPHTSRMKITTQKIGSIWHGYLEGCPEVDERGLTEEIARVKVERIVERRTDEARDDAIPP